MNSYQREIIDFLVDYGATGIEIVPGGKHPKVEFDFRGKHVAYTIANSSSDHRASANMIANLKNMLGEPAPEAVKETRRLSDMMPEAVERPTFRGKLALYPSGHANSPLMFRFFLPKTLIDAAGLSHGQQFIVSALDQYTWHFHSSTATDREHRPTLTTEKQTNDEVLFYVVRVAAGKLTKLGRFGISPTDCSIVGDALVVYLPPETITQLGAIKRGRKSPLMFASPAPLAAAPLAAAPADIIDDAPVAERLRALLAMIRSAERQTGYRLLRVRREDQSDGVWTWRAPEIRLDD